MAKHTPMKAIRKKCLECSCGQIKEVRMCQVKSALYTHIEVDTDPKMKKTPLKVFLWKKYRLAWYFLTQRGNRRKTHGMCKRRQDFNNYV